MNSIAFASKIASELRVTTSYAHRQVAFKLPPHTSELKPTFIGVMIDSTFFELSSSTPFKMLISSSRSGSSPVRWNCRKDLSSAFLYVWTSFLPRTRSRILAIGHAIGARSVYPRSISCEG